ncbi:unnamed protein product [Auanema sp. JU1783]|nr:unnamed protein product [Auanema sp. JU1783]
MNRGNRGNFSRGNSSNYGDRGGYRGGGRGGAFRGMSRRAPSFEDIPINAPLDLSSLGIPLKNNSTFTPRKPVANRKGCKEIPLLTNAYELKVKPSKIYLYDVAFFLNFEDGSRSELILNRDDSSSQNLFELKFYIMKKAMEDNNMCESGKPFAYDGNKLLYTYKEISKHLPKEGFLTLSPDDFAEPYKKLLTLRNLKSLDLIIQKADGHSEIQSTSFESSQMDGKLNSSDCSHSQAFDIITSMKAASTGDFLFFGGGVIYPKDQNCDITPDMQMKYDGLRKSTRIIEGKLRNKIVPVILMDYRMGQFLPQMLLRDYIANTARNVRANISSGIPPTVQAKVKQSLNGIRLESQTRKESLTFRKFSNETVSQLEVTKTTDKGKVKVPLASLYENIRCQKNFPAVVSAREKNGRFTPMMNVIEDLSIAPHQRVRLSRFSKASKNQIQAERPQVRHDKTNCMVKRIKLDGSQNEVLDSFQLSIQKDPMVVQAFYRQNPQLIYANGITKTPNADGAWMAKDKFFKPAEGFQIIALFDVPEFQELVSNFIENVRRELQSKGSVFQNVRSKCIRREELEKEFELIDTEKKRTILFYVADDDDIHGELKYYERKYLIPTQHVLSKNIKNERGEPLVKPMTLSNICLKTNLKTGGLNHTIKPDVHSSKIWISDKKTLVISYVLHRGQSGYDESMQFPSVVGYSFNGSTLNENFIGDFHLQDPQNQYVDLTVLNKIITHVLNLFVRSNKHVPEKIILLREGVADSQFSYIVDNELVEIKKSCTEYARAHNLSNWKPLFQFNLVTVMHNVRFFRFRERCSSEPSRGVEREVHNVNVATVMDCQIVRPNITEFFMQAHKVIKGSSRIPLYTTLIDEMNWSMDSLQSFMLGLCFTHQINEKPISLPEPLYQAKEWAKRGRDIALFYKCRIGTLGADYEELTRKFGYSGTRLETFRLNA